MTHKAKALDASDILSSNLNLGDGNISRKERPVVNYKCCARYVLSQQPDFHEQDPWLVEGCKRNDLSIMFYPRYHCELNPIEMIWGYVKAYHQKNCNYN